MLRISSERDLSNSYELLDRNVKRRLERLPGVGQVQLDGVLPREISIELIADRIAAHGIDLNALRERLQAANFSLSAGYMTDAGSGQRIRVTPVGEFTSLDDIRTLPVAEGLRLQDIADVRYAAPEMLYSRLLDREFALGI